MRYKRLFIVIGILFVIGLLVGGITYSIQSNKGKTLTDRDTGETLQLTTGVKTGGSGTVISGVTIFGYINLINQLLKSSNNTTGAYTDSIKSSFWDYSSKRLSDKYSTLTIRPQDLKINGLEIAGTIRLGQGDEILRFTITISSNKQSVTLRIPDTNNAHGGYYVYISGLPFKNFIYSITYDSSAQKSANQPVALTVTADPGYRNAAVNALSTLGYNPADFTYTFVGLKDPF